MPISVFSDAPVWFLIITIALLLMVCMGLGGYVLWSLRGILNEFREEVRDLKTVIQKLFSRDEKMDKRIMAIETRCALLHAGTMVGGRRNYDPKEECADKNP